MRISIYLTYSGIYFLRIDKKFTMEASTMKMCLIFILLMMFLITGCQNEIPATEEEKTSLLDTPPTEAIARSEDQNEVADEKAKKTVDTPSEETEVASDKDQEVAVESEQEVFSLFANISAEELQVVTDEVNYFLKNFTKLSKEKQIAEFLEIESMLQEWEIKVNEAWGAWGWIEQDNSRAQALLLRLYNYDLREFNIPDTLRPEQKIFLSKLNEAPFRWFSSVGLVFARVKYLVFQPILDTAPKNLSNYIELMISMHSELVLSDGTLMIPTHNFAELIILMENQKYNEFLSEEQKNCINRRLRHSVRIYLFGGENLEIWDQEIYNSGYYQIDQEWIDSFRKVLQNHPKSRLASYVQIAYDYLKEHDFNLGARDKNGFEQYQEAVRLSIQEKYPSND